MFLIQHHTADVRIAVQAPSLEELFVDAMRGLAAVMQPSETSATQSYSFAFDVDSVDTTSLLVDFLSDVLVSMHCDHAAFDEIVFDTLDATRATGRINGRAPVEFEEDVKAVTYHEAEVVQSPDGGWSTGIVLDL